jgi:hypothetical protein
MSTMQTFWWSLSLYFGEKLWMAVLLPPVVISLWLFSKVRSKRAPYLLQRTRPLVCQSDEGHKMCSRIREGSS